MATDELHVLRNKTLFVRNLPHGTTNEALETLFSEVGPIKQCFVVKNKASDQRKAIGFVKYSLLDDAITAVEQRWSLEETKLFVVYADRKKKQKKRGLDTQGETAPEPTSKTVKGSKKSDTHLMRKKSVVLKNMPDSCTQTELEEILKDVKGVSKVIYSEKCDKPSAVLKFKCVRDSQRAIRRLHNAEIKGKKLSAIQQSKDTSAIPANILKRSRLIVRNLSFKCKEPDLLSAFEAFGEITEVKVPTKPDGKMCGFGFVQFLSLVSADNAVKKMNGKEILNRVVAVDWALPKDKYLASSKNEKNTVKDQDSGAEESQSESSGTRSESSEESDDSSAAESDSDESGGESESDSDSSSSSYIDDDNKKTKKSKANAPQRKSDVEEGRTLFVRNLLFESQQEDVEGLFSPFGKVTCCRLVMNQFTGKSRGTAFVQFKKKEDAEKCLEASSFTDGGLSLDGRSLNIIRALNREQAMKQREDNKKTSKKDNRNLYLVREGMIRPGTESAKGLSKNDLDRRMKVEMVKRQKLKDPNIFVSPTRLCVRNIPISIDNKELKVAFIKAVDDKAARITECRVMRDLERVNTAGTAKSRGYAFIAFSDHQHALKALRNTNNNPELFGEKRRLIVEFSLENKKALDARQKRQERVQNRQEALKTDKSGNNPIRRERKKSDFSKKDLSKEAFVKPKNSGPKGLPSHWGPKIRHNPRQQATNKNKNSSKTMKGSRKRHIDGSKREPNEVPMKRQKKSVVLSDNFDKLVNNYRQKIMAASQKAQKASGKWTDS